MGKGTIVRELLARDRALWFSVSATDRAPRPGEVEGRDYFFVGRPEFRRMRDSGALLEWFEVYGDLKGTPRSPIEERLLAGQDVLLEVDVQGAMAVREAFPDALLIFVRPPSREVQQARLMARDPDADAAEIETRLAAAAREEDQAEEFDAVVLNDDLDRAVAEIAAILAGRRAESGSSGPTDGSPNPGAPKPGAPGSGAPGS